MQIEDVSLKLLREALHACRYDPRYSGYHEKPASARLTKTERSVLDLVGSGKRLGYYSSTLTYSPALRGLTKPQRGALLSLIQRGRLIVELIQGSPATREEGDGPYGESYLLRRSDDES